MKNKLMAYPRTFPFIAVPQDEKNATFDLCL